MESANGTSEISDSDITEFVLSRFKSVQRLTRIKYLVEFHARNKYLIMSRDQSRLKILGRIVASYKRTANRDRQDNTLRYILKDYEENLRLVLERQPTIKTHSNVIMHVFGHFSNEFTSKEKVAFIGLVDKFKRKELMLGTVLSAINPMIYKFNKTYLANQTYFLLYAEPQRDLFTSTIPQNQTTSFV